jgi:predicted  nucleic acid-binding Zn-ribbon protein
LGKDVDKIQEQIRELEKKVANLEKRIIANEKRITAIQLKLIVSKAYRIAMIEALNNNGYDGEGWAAEVDAFFDGLAEEQRKEFAKVPLEDSADLMRRYRLIFPWEQ